MSEEMNYNRQGMPPQERPEVPYGSRETWQSGGRMPHKPEMPNAGRQGYPYGQQPYHGWQQVPPVEQPSNGIGTAGFVLALVTVFFSWLPFVGVLTWILGVVFSAIGLGRKPRGLAVAGLIISLILPVLLILAVVALFALGTISDIADLKEFGTI